MGSAGEVELALPAVGTVLIATDADEVFDEVDAALSDQSTTVARVRAGKDVLGAVKESEPELVVVDMQIGNMGGMATCMNLRLEEGGERLDPQKVIMLLDRSPMSSWPSGPMPTDG